MAKKKREVCLIQVWRGTCLKVSSDEEACSGSEPKVSLLRES